MAKKIVYAEKLKDPRWQKKRLEIMERDLWACKICGGKEKTLHVHHIKYVQGREPWGYHDDNFITLCEECHDYEHNGKDELVHFFREFMYDLSKIGVFKKDILRMLNNVRTAAQECEDFDNETIVGKERSDFNAWIEYDTVTLFINESLEFVDDRNVIDHAQTLLSVKKKYQ